MNIFALILLQPIVAIVAAVLLIQMGGWLPILVAILSVLLAFGNAIAIAVLAIGYAHQIHKTKTNEEEENHERLGT